MGHKSFIPELESVHGIQAFVNESLADHINDPGRCLKIDLVVEEISVNIIKYGLRDRPEGELLVATAVHDDHAVLTFKDNGPEFNPLKSEPPDTSAGLEKRKPGGLGVFLVRQIADRIYYSREDGHNTLRLEFDIEPKTG